MFYLLESLAGLFLISCKCKRIFHEQLEIGSVEFEFVKIFGLLQNLLVTQSKPIQTYIWLEMWLILCKRTLQNKIKIGSVVFGLVTISG